MCSFLQQQICQKRPANETHKHQKRPTNIKRDLQTSTEIDNIKGDQQTIKRDQQISKKTNMHQKRPTYIKRDLHTSKVTDKYQKRPRAESRADFLRNIYLLLQEGAHMVLLCALCLLLDVDMCV